MKVGIINIEPKIFNTAYMQIANYYRQRGHSVEWWSPIMHKYFDAVFCSSLFDFTDKSQIPTDVICGGTGYNVKSRLSKVIEGSNLDYSIYPKCHKSYIWFSRGCPRKCPWCVVPEKEGHIKPIPPKNLNPRGEYIVICDNNFFASPMWREAIAVLQHCQSFRQPLDFQQGIDIRIITEEQSYLLSTLRHHKRIKFAWDIPGDKERILAGIKRLTKYVKPYRLMCYVLVGYASTQEQDLRRIETLRSMGVDPFVMPYDKNDLYQRTLTRWVNHKAIYKSVAWEEYRQRVNKQEIAGTGWLNYDRT